MLVAMKNLMKILGVAALGVVVLIVILGLVLVVYAKSEATTCYGIFNSGDAAGRAADAARDAGFDGRLGHPGNGCLERGPFEHEIVTTAASPAFAPRAATGHSDVRVSFSRVSGPSFGSGRS
ncbi:MAG: hypothetical protein KY463_00405 [Actinobacteria bacterium]|nr:hypothetical protein [Actinomycetota bacterium]